MDKIDSVKSFSQTQNEFSVQGNSVSGGPKENQLPKDVLEAMSRGDMELAMLLLKLHQKGEKGEGMIAKFFSLFFRIGTVFFPETPRAERTVKKKGAAPRIERTEPRVTHLLRQAGKVASFSVRAAIQTVVIVGKMVVFVTKEILIPAAVIGKKVAFVLGRTLYRPIAKRFEKGIHAIEKFYENYALALQEKIKAKLKEKIDEIKELAKPVEKWLSKRFEELVGQKDFFAQALGAQMVHVQKAADFAFQLAAFAIAPALLFKKSMTRRLQAIGKGWMQARRFFRRSLAKGLGLFSKGLQAAGFAFLRLGRELKSGFPRFLRWLFQKLKALLRKMFRNRNRR